MIVSSLRTRRDFDRVFQEGERVGRGPVTVIVRRRDSSDLFVFGGSPSADESADVTRLGLVVSRRVGNAVVRNRAKRRLRHAVRRSGGAPGHDVVVIADARVPAMDWRELVDRVDDGLCGAMRRIDKTRTE